jgi:DNA-binding transcriptional LysR family regulator
MLFDGRIVAGITIFVAVAKAGSYAGATKQVGLSRSGVGKAIARLEARTGMRLFDRNSRALKLTDEGRVFLDEVMPMLERLGRIARPSTPDQLRGRLRIATDAAFGPFLLIPALPEFLTAHPHVKVDLLVRDRIDSLLLEGVDLAIRFGEPNAHGLNKRLLMRRRVVTCASRTYLDRHGAPTTPHDILDHHQCIRMLDDVTGKPHVWTFANAAGEQQPISPDCGLTLNDAPSLLAAVSNDHGIVRLLDFVAEEGLRSGRLVEVLPEWNHLMWPAYLYAPTNSYQSHAVDAVSSFVLSHSFPCPDPAVQ